MSNIYKYKDILTITLDKDGNYIESIDCKLEVLGSGMDRIVYRLSDAKCLKVAKTIRASCINYEEVTLWQNIKGKECCVQLPEIFDYEEDYCFWYVYEIIEMDDYAMVEATKLIPILDQANNAGYDTKGRLTVVDADRINYTWFLKETDPYTK